MESHIKYSALVQLIYLNKDKIEFLKTSYVNKKNLYAQYLIKIITIIYCSEIG